jgi:hypothetical protein
MAKLLQEKKGNTLDRTGSNFMNKTQQLREMINKWDCMKLFCTEKETVTRLKRQPKEWKKIFVSYISEKG